MGVAYAVWSGLGTAVIAVVGVVWFRERGSRSVRFRVRVSTEPEAASDVDDAPADAASTVDTAPETAAPRDEALVLESSDAVDPQEFPMYGFPREDVLALLDDASLEVVAVDDDRSCGEDWISYRYFARKPSR